VEVYDCGGLSWSQMHIGGIKLLAGVLGLGQARPF
jgi:hypothetical protein